MSKEWWNSVSKAISANREKDWIKENKFEVKCRICNYVGDAKDFVVEVDVWMTPEKNIERKEATIKCPNCTATETLPITIW